jgi:predicted MFS family arabinose efflux permease
VTWCSSARATLTACRHERASRMLAYGAAPPGALVGGLVASEYGLIAPWPVGGVLSLLVAVLSLPSRRRWDS